MYGVSLQWKRCPDGVEVHDYGSEKRGGTILAGTTQKHGPYFRYRTGRRDALRHELADLENPIIVHFVNATGEDRLAEFFGRFGFLTEVGDVSRTAAIDWREACLALLRRAGSGDPKAAVNAVNKALAGHDKFAQTPVLDLSAKGGQPRLALQSLSLLSFMQMEAAFVAINGARLAACEHCGNHFLTGPTTGRRSTAQFCSDRCRVAAMRARKEKSS